MKKYLLHLVAFVSGILLSSLVFMFIFIQNSSQMGGNSVELVEQKDRRFVEERKQNNAVMDHSMHSMEDMKSMPMMNDMLKNYTDRDFLELMILHHQDALDMANNALENSKNEFIIKLSNEIIKTQSAEISQMEQELKNVNN